MNVASIEKQPNRRKNIVEILKRADLFFATSTYTSNMLITPI
jgi:hypothetical protein